MINQVSLLVVHLQNAIILLVFQLQSLLQVGILDLERYSTVLIGSIVTETVLHLVELVQGDSLAQSIDVLLWGLVKVIERQFWLSIGFLVAVHILDDFWFVSVLSKILIFGRQPASTARWSLLRYID